MFEEGEENKFEYMSLFNQYQELVGELDSLTRGVAAVHVNHTCPPPAPRVGRREGDRRAASGPGPRVHARPANGVAEGAAGGYACLLAPPLLLGPLRTRWLPPSPPPGPERLEGDVFDLLMTMSDFGEFKDLMLSFKREKEFGEGACEHGRSLGRERTAPA